jgi:regulatory protein
MIITEISNCKRNKNRINIYVDGAFAFALYLETALQHGLKKDMDISSLDLEQIAADDEKKYAMDISLKYIAYQMRSEREVLKKLKQKGVSDEASNEALQKLIELGYLNDRVYAETYAAELKARMGSRGIFHKLYEKGINKELVQDVLQNMGGFEEVAAEQARILFEKYRNLDEGKAKQKVFRTLMGRGFEMDDIRRAVRMRDE